MSKDALPVTGEEQAVYALVDIKAGNGTVPGTMPMNFALVLDRSGSMDGEKLENMKEAVGYMVDHMGDRDTISVTIFDDQVEVLVPNQPVKNRDEIKAWVSQVIARGGTQISDGLRAGMAELKKGCRADRVNRMLLLTDGRTWDDEDACLKLADEAGRQGIALTSVGLGEEWNEKLLLEIGERSRGDSHWIQNPGDILDAFRSEVTGMQSIAATNLKLTARMSPGARLAKVYVTLPMIAEVSRKAIKDNAIVMDLGSLDGKKGQMMLIEARVPAHKEGPFLLGQVEVSYDIPSQGVQNESSKHDLSVTFAGDAASASKVNAEVMNIVEKLSAFKLQTRALTLAETGNIAGATRKLQAAATVFLNMGEDELARTAEREVLGLEKTGALSAAGTKKLEYGTRKLTQTMK
jgi:Ca-activated chloride channel family protein